MNFKYILAICVALALTACKADYTVHTTPDIIMFSAENYTLGVVDSEEWLEIPVSATKVVNYDRNIGVEVIAKESSAVEGLHYVVESNTLTIAKGKLTTALRIRGLVENIGIGEELTLTLNLVLDDENVSDMYGTRSEVSLQRCCKFDINNFVGYAKITSTWTMQYMNSDACLVSTELGADNKSIIIKNMFYDGYDIEVTFDDSNILEPRVILPEAQVLGSTGEAFGTIYGDGKLLMSEPMGYTSYFGACENFMVLYTMMYVENVGTVGTYVNIFEWVSDDEAERIKREGF
ncbi:MAG: DUF4984 domain-containing protein [Alistipes sp.]|nr:DUF4984 domain-containing protein [Alistipes sp.]MBO7262914.1 DUF4984 domain-containing protein [Alistipes sp.]